MHIGWAGHQEDAGDAGHDHLQMVPERVLTEEAAIVMAALVLYHLEDTVVVSVSEMGTRYDYRVETGRLSGRVASQVEVSGVRHDRTGAAFPDRCREKKAQLLDRNDSGFVAVAAFGVKSEPDARGHLSFVRRASSGPPGAEPVSSQSLDPQHTAEDAAAEGRSALARGDTAEARRKYTEAAEHYRSHAARPLRAAGRHLALFLAASHFYYGGEYGRALRAARRVEERLLPRDVRPLFRPSLTDFRRRAKPGYALRIRQTVVALLDRGQGASALNLLKEHPFAMKPGVLAYSRALALEQVGDSRAAARFFAAAAERSGRSLKVLASASGAAVTLLNAGRLDEAEHFAAYMLSRCPHAVTNAIASVVAYERWKAEPDDRPRWRSLQVEAFKNMKQMFFGMPVDLDRQSMIGIDLFAPAVMLACAALREAFEAEGDPAELARLVEDTSMFEPFRNETPLDRQVSEFRRLRELGKLQPANPDDPVNVAA